MRAGGPRSNFVGYVQTYPTPAKRAHTPLRRTREVSKSSENFEMCGSDRRGLFVRSETTESRAAGSSAR